ncbi:hypothetical protein GCM10017744_048760 [Streptomyces antimycoticus]
MADPVAAVAFIRTQAIVIQPQGFMQSLPNLVVLVLLIAPLPVLAITAQRRQGQALAQ